MNRSQKLLTFAGLAVCAGAAAFFLLNHRSEVDPEIPGGPHAQDPERKPEQAKPASAASRTAPTRTEEPARTEVTLGGSGAEDLQGVKGRVLDPFGAPVPKAKVYLMPGTGTNPLEMLINMGKGIVYPPVARGESDGTGAFALGIERPDPAKSFELRVVTDKYVDHALRNLRIAANDWYDAGNVTLEAGIAVTGTVSVAGTTGIAVPGATITIKGLGNSFGEVAPTPGREKGYLVKADENGRYRFENAPSGLVNISAVAPNYARADRPNQNLEKTVENVVNFELQEGKMIDGTVLDAQLQSPVAGAKVTAVAISSKTPVTEDTRTGPDGRFELMGLIDAQYQITVVAQGFCNGDAKPIAAGTRGLQISLEKQGVVRVQVYGKSGRLLTTYTLNVKRVFEGQELFGNTDVPAKLVRNPKEGIGTVEGLNPDKYVLQVEAEGHARAYSEQFQIVAGGEPPLLVVRMNEGGVLKGLVVDEAGKPLPGVTVSTLPNEYDENPFTQMFAGMIPSNITRISVTTTAEGAYRMPMLNEGKYQLKFQDPGHFDVYVKALEVHTGVETEVPAQRMERGTLVTGTVLLDGAPAGQVKVSISALQDPTKPGKVGFSCDAITDSTGVFKMGKRAPPGRYEVRAARQTLANPLEMIVDMQKTKQEVELGAGQDASVVSFSLTSK